MEFRDARFIAEIKKLNYHDLLIFLIPVIIFSIYLLVFNPGIATYDSFNQLHQIASQHFTNWHPFFHTFINMLCLYVYPSTISICIFQILVFSTMWMIICKYNRDNSIKTDKTFNLQVAISIIICIIPINGLYSITLWKDVLFSYFLMFLCFLAKVMIDKKGNVGYKFIILLSVIMAFVAQLRGNGMYVVLVVLVVYSIYLFMKKNIKMGVLLPILTITCILLISSLNIVYDVEDNEKDAMMTKISHMLADYDLNLEIEDSDRQKIYELMDKDKIKDQYIPTGTDPIFAIMNYKTSDTNKSTYIGLALKYSLRNPLHCVQYLFESAPMTWDIVRDDNWIGRPYYLSGESDRLQKDYMVYYDTHNYTPKYSYENLSYANWGTLPFDLLNLASLGIEGTPVLDTLFNSPALYMYLSIIILILLHVMFRYREIYLMYIPNLLNIIIVFLSTPIQDNRYLYANLLVCYLLIIILIGARQRSANKIENSSKPA
ncbi:MAG: hypothetical protein IKE95_05555 [Methanobrevibacter sp.]|nr:hypothetical protein [Methanobrevibacter sp.]